LKIALIVEGQTEKAFLPRLRSFLLRRLEGDPPKLRVAKQAGRVPKGEKLKKIVTNLLSDGADAVIALTDVYTGQREFKDADDAIRQMTRWVGQNPQFRAHAVQYEFEAWLLPYWEVIQRLSGSDRRKPSEHPETVNHDKPPSRWISEAYRTGSRREDYVKARDVTKILEGQDLEFAARECPQLRAFLNTILDLCGGEPLS
jgi:hypothetical protein